jgi:hypothetical protein
VNHTPIAALHDELCGFTLTVRSALTGEVTLTGSEVRNLCLAIELDRVQRGDAVALLTRRRMSRKPLTWRKLMDGARGLTQADAPGVLTVAAALARVGVEVVRFELAAQSPREALARVRESGKRGAA